MSGARLAARRVRRRLSWHRRPLAAVLAGLATVTALGAARAPAPETVTVLAAARPLDGGAPLAADDVREVALPPDAVPDGALTPGDGVAGRVPAGPVAAGAPLTDVRLVGPSLLGRYADDGLVGVPVRLDDPRSAALLSAGDRVDVLSATPPEVPGAGQAADEPAEVVASGVRVVSVPEPGEDALLGGPAGQGALVVLAADHDDAARLTAADANARLSVLLRGG